MSKGAPGFFHVDERLADLSAKQRNAIAEKLALKEGRIPEDWRDKPAKLTWA